MQVRGASRQNRLKKGSWRGHGGHGGHSNDMLAPQGPLGGKGKGPSQPSASFFLSDAVCENGVSLARLCFSPESGGSHSGSSPALSRTLTHPPTLSFPSEAGASTEDASRTGHL